MNFLRYVDCLCTFRNPFRLPCQLILRNTTTTMTTQIEGQSFPKTLEGFGYKFNDVGKLRKLDPKTGDLTNTPFEFNISSDAMYNQRHYEALGEVITETVYGLLDDEGLERLPVPPDSEESSFIFATKDALESDKLVILIHGAGVVRAGQWARSLIINDCLESGTQLAYIRKARNSEFGVLVFNTNDNHRYINGTRVPIKGSSSPEEHAHTAWQNYVLPSKATKVLLVAHSFGGVVTMSLAAKFEEDFLKRVFAIALTDSVHGKIPRAVSSTLADHLAKVARNWVSSNQPLDEALPEQPGEIQCFSAGTVKHEMTSHSCIESVFSFLEGATQSGPLASGRDS